MVLLLLLLVTKVTRCDSPQLSSSWQNSGWFRITSVER